MAHLPGAVNYVNLIMRERFTNCYLAGDLPLSRSITYDHRRTLKDIAAWQYLGRHT